MPQCWFAAQRLLPPTSATAETPSHRSAYSTRLAGSCPRRQARSLLQAAREAQQQFAAITIHGQHADTHSHAPGRQEITQPIGRTWQHIAPTSTCMGRTNRPPVQDPIQPKMVAGQFPGKGSPPPTDTLPLIPIMAWGASRNPVGWDHGCMVGPSSLASQPQLGLHPCARVGQGTRQRRPHASAPTPRLPQIRGL